MIDDFFGWYVSMIWWAHLEPMVFHFVCVDLWGELLYFCGQLLPVWSVAVDDLLTIRRRFPNVVRQLLFTGLLGNLQSVQFILQGLSKYKKVNGVGNKVKEDGQWTEGRNILELYSPHFVKGQKVTQNKVTSSLKFNGTSL